MSEPSDSEKLQALQKEHEENSKLITDMGNELEELYEVIKGLESERDELKAKCEELEKK
jgi:predicted  nucleic acid-binding Zn-ribbon protein